MNEQALIDYYNKFNEDKRLTRRHGKVEFVTTIKYIEEILKEYNNPKILDIGAGTGAYSIYLNNLGYDVTALELVKHNLKVIEKKNKNIKLIHGNAINLSMLKDKTYDVILMLGPMYHLISEDEKVCALNEAKRVLKDDGTIIVAYITNEYAMITHAFKERKLLESLDRIADNFHIKPKRTDLYSYVRLEDIDKLNKIVNLKRKKIVASDTVANYFREYINKLNDEEFAYFIKYHLSICERLDCLGLSTHLIDIVKK